MFLGNKNPKLCLSVNAILVSGIVANVIQQKSLVLHVASHISFTQFTDFFNSFDR